MGWKKSLKRGEKRRGWKGRKGKSGRGKGGTRNTPIGVVVREPSAVSHYFCGGLPPKIEVWGALTGAKVTPSDSPPSICYKALESPEYLKSPDCRERFSIFMGVCLPKLGFGGNSRGQKLYHRIARPRFAKISLSSCLYLKALGCYVLSYFSIGELPPLYFWGHS